jgi:microcystin-dependent protein
MTSTLRTNAALSARQRPTTGDTKMSFVNTDHMGWMMCDGRTMDKTAYNLLFQVIGYTFGGSGNSFNLPNPAGRVMGTIGTVTDDDARSRTYTAGQSVGELDHKLTVAEMPAHDHDSATGSPGANTTAVGTTSAAGGHTHTITDPGHNHSYINNINNQDVNTLTTQATAASNADLPATTGTSVTNITINAVGNHTHTIASNGNDQYHNNIQPTLFYGNTFIYCGIPVIGNYPFNTGIAPVLI